MSGNGKQLCPCQCHWDLSWLRFGDTRIAVSDVDGLFVVERTGYFLFIETKRKDEALPKGQEILLAALSRIPTASVVILRGDKGYPSQLQKVKNGRFEEAYETNRQDFQRRLDTWFEEKNNLRRLIR